jgi:predicted acylesterase/phospholipase RssA
MKTAVCLPGGGASGAMFQIGALTALEKCLNGFSSDGFDAYIGSSSGASVAAALAAGQRAPRIYRAFLDPKDGCRGVATHRGDGACGTAPRFT